MHPYIAPRDAVGSFRVSQDVLALLRSEGFDLLVSTGAALAAVSLLRAPALLPTMYVESLARSEGPSLTGRAASVRSSTALFTQHPNWARGRWSFAGSVLDTWVLAEPVARPDDKPMKILVTLGTIHPYRFDRLIDAVLEVAHEKDEITWQLGSTTRVDLPGTVHSHLAAHDLLRVASESEVVVTHAGVGNVLMALSAGRVPVLGARQKLHREHVDDHQRQLAAAVVSRGLGEQLDLSDPSRAALQRAAGARVIDRLI
ncbi:hypothetical protein PUW80_14230 [Microbacterium sp. NE1TT3]|uniref:Glycosyltransferase n=2 Tax=Microbacterium thalli TaxID=3027921 RepID=A0ABT5SL00_9MICO|nr:hypothetical protein [Microbacterium thalli]